MSACLFARCLRLFRLNVVSTDPGTFPFYANLHNWGMKCKTLTFKTKKLLQRSTVTGDFTTSMSLVPGSASFCVQNWHRFCKVLETILTNFADLSVYMHDINLVFYHIPKVDHCEGHLHSAKSLSCLRNQFKVIWGLWHGALCQDNTVV